MIDQLVVCFFRIALVTLLVPLNCRAASWGALSAVEFTGPTFERLTDEERELLAEYAEKLASFKELHQSLRLRAKQVISRRNPDKEWQPDELIETEVLRLDEAFYRATRRIQGTDGTVIVRMLLIDNRELWHLKQDPQTGRFFVGEHAREQPRIKGERFGEWWVDASFTLARSTDLEDSLLTDNQTCRLNAVRSLLDDDGERLIEIHAEMLPRADLKRPGDERHPTPFIIVRLYRDHYCVLKDAEDRSYSVGTTTQSRNIQQCRYVQNPSKLPLLRTVVRTGETRDLSQSDDETAWRTVYRERTEIEEIVLEKPDASSFRLENFIDPARRLKSPGTDRLKWFFGANGLVLLALWYLLSRRQRRRANSNSGSAV